MTRRRLAVVAAACAVALSPFALPDAGAAEVNGPSVATSTWGCVANDVLRVGVCLANPLGP